MCFYAKTRDLKIASLGKRALVLVRFRESLLSTIQTYHELPSVFISLWRCLSGGDTIRFTVIKKFPFNVLANEVVQAPTDVTLVDEVGDIGIDQYLQVLDFHLASIGRSREKRHRKLLLKDNEDMRLKEQLDLKEIVILDLKKKLSDMEEELKVEKNNHVKDVELLKRENDLSNLNNQVIEVTVKLKNMESNRETEILDAFAEGFKRTVTQAKLLSPEGDFSAMDPSKVVRDRLLVDDENAVEDGDDNLAD